MGPVHKTGLCCFWCACRQVASTGRRLRGGTPTHKLRPAEQITLHDLGLFAASSLVRLDLVAAGLDHAKRELLAHPETKVRKKAKP